ncbi:hypothetical protein ANTPLA_LOCUS8419 [Anthophora plagiata]
MLVEFPRRVSHDSLKKLGSIFDLTRNQPSCAVLIIPRPFLRRTREECLYSCTVPLQTFEAACKKKNMIAKLSDDCN